MLQWPVQKVVSEERAQRISRARTSRSEAYRLAQRASSIAAQAERDAAVSVSACLCNDTKHEGMGAVHELQ